MFTLMQGTGAIIRCVSTDWSTLSLAGYVEWWPQVSSTHVSTREWLETSSTASQPLPLASLIEGASGIPRTMLSAEDKLRSFAY